MMFRLKRQVLRVIVGLGCLAVLLILAVFLLDDDVSQAYVANPEHLREVRILAPPLGVVGAARVAHDFDGDGFPDEFTLEYWRVEPLFRDSTSGLLRVRSGRDGHELLAYATDTPLDSVSWVGDIDGNGTDDLRVTNLIRDVCLLHPH